MIIENVGNFSVTKTFDCGQCFRFDPVPGEEECFEGVAPREVTKRVKPDFVIVGEATSTSIKIGQRGRAEVVVETEGVTRTTAR